MEGCNSDCQILASQEVQSQLLLNITKLVKPDRASQAFCLPIFIGQTALCCVTKTLIK